MRIVSIHDDGALDEAVKVIADGGVVVHPTETCYGIACDLANFDAVRMLFAAKQRPPTMPVSALFSSVEQAQMYTVWSDKALELAEKYLPGPLTLVLPVRDDAADIHVALMDKSPTIGVRISSHPFTKQLVGACDIPLSTTSANIHDRPNPYSAEEVILQYFEERLQPHLLLEDGEIPEVEPSTVVEVIGDEVKVLRAGSTEI